MTTAQTQARSKVTLKDIGFVVDTLAIAEPRIHGVPTTFDKAGKAVVIKNYKLSAAEPTEMPLGQAMLFLKDPAFIVTNAEGEVLKPLDNIKEKTTHLVIPEGYVVASYEELSKAALVLRAKVLPNSGSIHPVKSKVEDIIAFLKAQDSASKKPASTATADATEEELDRMFPDDEPL